jgi:hypothetical protein
MQTPGSKNSYRRANDYFNLKVLWLAFFAAALNCVAIAYLNLEKPDLMQAWSSYAPNVVDRPFVMIGLASIFLSHFVPKYFLTQARGRSETERPSSVVFIYFILKWVLLELCSMVGFANAMILKDIAKMFPFITVGLLGLLLAIPTQSSVENVLKALSQRKG